MKKNIVFSKLTPTDDVRMDVYDDALEYIFGNKDIKNVAIAGSYGAGKSSLLESYKKKHSDKKFLHISLAHFEETAGNSAAGKNQDTEVVLEGKILNQLIQQVDVDNIPQTNFHIKRTVNNSRCIAFAVGAVIFLLALFWFRICLIAVDRHLWSLCPQVECLVTTPASLYAPAVFSRCRPLV